MDKIYPVAKEPSQGFDFGSENNFKVLKEGEKIE